MQRKRKSMNRKIEKEIREYKKDIKELIKEIRRDLRNIEKALKRGDYQDAGDVMMILEVAWLNEKLEVLSVLQKLLEDEGDN